MKIYLTIPLLVILSLKICELSAAIVNEQFDVYPNYFVFENENNLEVNASNGVLNVTSESGEGEKGIEILYSVDSSNTNAGILYATVLANNSKGIFDGGSLIDDEVGTEPYYEVECGLGFSNFSGSGWITLNNRNGTKTIEYTGGELDVSSLDDIYLRVSYEFGTNTAKSYYSMDGQNFTELGSEYAPNDNFYVSLEVETRNVSLEYGDVYFDNFVISADTYYDSTLTDNPENILDFLTIVPMEDGNWILECDDTLAGDVVLPSSYNGTPITKIYANAFEDCDLVTSIVVPEGILEIQEYAFYNCEGLALISLPESLSVIGNHSFSGCRSLDNIILPNAITTIERYTFSNCSSLVSISFPLNLTSIESMAFSRTGITSITIPDNVSLNGYLHFDSCDKLVEINLPDTLTSIPAMAFWGCSSLTTINIPQSVQRIELSAFRECDNLQNIQLPNSLEEIGDNAFYGCDNIDLIQLPNSLVSIGESAFENCTSLKSITIPESLASLGKYSFRDCPLLEYIYFEGDNHFTSSEFPFLGSNPKIYFNENTNGWDNSPFSLVWEMIEKPVAMVTYSSQINEMEVSYEEVSQNYVLYSSDSLMGPYTPVENQSIQVTTGANGQITKVFNDTVTTSKFYKLVLSLDDYHSN